MYRPFFRLLPLSNVSKLILPTATRHVGLMRTKRNFSASSANKCNNNQATTTKRAGWDRIFPPYMVNERPLLISIARPEDAEELYKFSLRHLFPAAPLRQIHRFDESEETRNPLWKLEQYQDYLKQPYSVIVRDPDAGNEIVSFLTSKIIYRSTFDIVENPEAQHQTKDRSPGWICRGLYAELRKDLDLFSQFNTDRIFYLCTGAAHQKFLRSGVIYHIGSSIINVAEEEGIGVQAGEAFSQFTTYALSKHGFKILKEVKYEDFEIDGEKPLAGIPEMGVHTAATVMVRLSKGKAQI